jgi:hypothetical protein
LLACLRCGRGLDVRARTCPATRPCLCQCAARRSCGARASCLASGAALACALLCAVATRVSALRFCVRACACVCVCVCVCVRAQASWASAWSATRAATAPAGSAAPMGNVCVGVARSCVVAGLLGPRWRLPRTGALDGRRGGTGAALAASLSGCCCAAPRCLCRSRPAAPAWRACAGCYKAGQETTDARDCCYGKAKHFGKHMLKCEWLRYVWWPRAAMGCAGGAGTALVHASLVPVALRGHHQQPAASHAPLLSCTLHATCTSTALATVLAPLDAHTTCPTRIHTYIHAPCPCSGSGCAPDGDHCKKDLNCCSEECGFITKLDTAPSCERLAGLAAILQCRCHGACQGAAPAVNWRERLARADADANARCLARGCLVPRLCCCRLHQAAGAVQGGREHLLQRRRVRPWQERRQSL